MDQSSISLHALPKTSRRGKKRVGRGYGSGKGGHTSGRGQKGQRSRRTIPWSFEGGALPLSHRLPFWRGKGRLNPLKPKPAIVNVGDLERLKTGTAVDMALLIKEGFLTEKEARVQRVKILGRGKLTKKLTIVGIAVSVPARSKIEKAGGKIAEKRVEIEIEKKKEKKNLGPSEKTVKKVEKVEKAEKSEMVKTVKIAEKKMATDKKVVKKKVVATQKKTAVKNKKAAKKASK